MIQRQGRTLRVTGKSILTGKTAASEFNSLPGTRRRGSPSDLRRAQRAARELKYGAESGLPSVAMNTVGALTLPLAGHSILPEWSEHRFAK